MTSLLEQLASPKGEVDPPITEYFALSKDFTVGRGIRFPHHGVKIGVNGVPAPRRSPFKTASPRQLNDSARSSTGREMRLTLPDQLCRKDFRGREVRL